MRFLLLIFFSSCILSPAISQTNISGNLVSAYQSASNSTYSVEWNIGEVLNETFETGDYIVSSGLPVISIVAGIDEVNEIDKIRLFPNPFSNTVTVESDVLQLNNLEFNFFDALGKKMNVNAMTMKSNQAIFFTEYLPSGIYILAISQDNKKLLTHIKLIRE
jgi:hypothetical protein